MSLVWRGAVAVLHCAALCCRCAALCCAVLSLCCAVLSLLLLSGALCPFCPCLSDLPNGLPSANIV
jgi:hypothetical protein